MKRYLFLLRHAEAERENADGDINRPLTPRGTESVGLLGEKLRSRNESVQRIWSSTAVRAADTARRICAYLEYPETGIAWRPELYLASPGDLLACLTACPANCESLLLVGHNPGLQSMVGWLATPGTLPADRSLTTAAVAKLEIGVDWRDLQPECAQLSYLLKPEII